MAVEQQGTREARTKEGGAEWLVYTVIGLLAATLLVSAWNTRLTQSLQHQLLSAIGSQQSGYDSGVFLSADGWRPGQVAPAVELRAPDGQAFSFAEVATEHEVVYVGWDNCRVCLEHFPELNRAATEVEAANGSFAMVMLLSATDDASEDTPITGLASMQREHGWNFPVYELDRSALLELNLQGTPTVLILRRGILGEAFISGSFERLIARIVGELRLGGND